MSRKLPSSYEDIDGTTKAAVLLVTLDTDVAAALLKHLPPWAVEQVSRQVASIGRVPDLIREKVVEEFYSASLAHAYSNEGGLTYARVLLKESLDPSIAERILQQIQTQVQRTPFAFLQKAESENLLTFIQDEHPQTIALIVCHLPHHKAAEILGGLSLQKQIEVVKRIATMDQTNPEVIKEVEQALEARLSSLLSQATEKSGGVPTVAEILNLAGRATEKAIMEGLETEDPELVEDIRRLMFVFEDILMLDSKAIQALLKETDNEELVLALKTASEDLKQKFFTNMSERAAVMIKEDMQYMGPVRVSDVESAQQRIVDTVRRLEDAGEIMIAGRGGEEEFIV